MRDDNIISLGRRASPTGAAEGGSTEAYRRPPAAPSDLQMLRRKRAEFEEAGADFDRYMAAFDVEYHRFLHAAVEMLDAFRRELWRRQVENFKAAQPGMTPRADGRD